MLTPKLSFNLPFCMPLGTLCMPTYFYPAQIQHPTLQVVLDVLLLLLLRQCLAHDELTDVASGRRRLRIRRIKLRPIDKVWKRQDFCLMCHHSHHHHQYYHRDRRRHGAITIRHSLALPCAVWLRLPSLPLFHNGGVAVTLACNLCGDSVAVPAFCLA